MTQSGFLVGTPGYMAPEQAGGKRALVGPATDIYALGGVLYQLLTGQLPFQRDSTLELLRAVTSDEPTSAAPPAAPLAARPGSDHAALSGEGAQPSLPQRPGAGRRPGALPRGETGDGAAGGGRRAAGPRVPAPAAGRAVGRPSRRLPVRGTGWGDLEMAGSERTTGPGERPCAAGGRRETGGPVPGLPGLRGRRQRGAARTTTWPTRPAISNAAPEALRGWEWRHLRSRLDDSSAVVPLPAVENGFADGVASMPRISSGLGS